jgi:hypothetical protein
VTSFESGGEPAYVSDARSCARPLLLTAAGDWIDVVGANPCRNPARQLAQIGCQPRALFALLLDEPRPSVIHRTATDPAMILASQAGTCIGGLAPTASASYGSHWETRAGSSSVML